MQNSWLTRLCVSGSASLSLNRRAKQDLPHKSQRGHLVSWESFSGSGPESAPEPVPGHSAHLECLFNNSERLGGHRGPLSSSPLYSLGPRLWPKDGCSPVFCEVDCLLWHRRPLQRTCSVPPPLSPVLFIFTFSFVPFLLECIFGNYKCCS